MAASPNAIAQKWQRNLAGATESIRQGVQGTSVSPTERAAARTDAYVAGVQRAVADGKYQAGLRRVTLADWQRAMIDKGLPRVASGAAAAQGKVQEFMAEFLPFVEAGVSQINRDMPRGDLEQNIQRAAAIARHNATFRRRSS